MGHKMKRIFLFLVLALVFGGSLLAADFSLNAGTGALAGGLFTRYSAESSSGTGEMTQEINQFNYGGLVFFDATYAELSVYVQGGLYGYNEVMMTRLTSDSPPSLVPRTGDGWETVLGFSLLGKYPFSLTPAFKLFPLLGLDYQIALSEKRKPSGGITHDRTDGILDLDVDGNAYDLSVWNSSWIIVGIGADFSIMKRVFLRGELLCGFRLMNPYESDGLEQMKIHLNDTDPKLGGITCNPSLRLGVGYRMR